MLAKATLLIRVDAGAKVGIGHVMRCLALAQGWQDAGGRVLVVMAMQTPAILARLQAEGLEVALLSAPGGGSEDAIQTGHLAQQQGAEWVVVDGYRFDADYQKTLKDLGYRLLAIDDYAHLDHYWADIILNQNTGAEAFPYNAEPYAKLLLGPRYVSLRRDFLKYTYYDKEIPEVAKRLLITLGGVDFENYTLKVLKAVNLVKIPLEIKIIIGARNPHYGLIKEEFDKGDHKIKVLKDVNNMAPLMAWADIGASAGGITIWELAFMKLPAVLFITAANQLESVSALVKGGVFNTRGWLKNNTIKEISEALADLIFDKNLRGEFSKKGREVVDGKGVSRIIAEMITRGNNK